MSFNHSQIQAINHFKGPALVLAGPGSGKTLVITQRTKKLIVDYGVSPSNILVVTFTRAAAREMKERFFRLMGQSLPVSFGTFHAIFFNILKYAYGINGSSIVREEQVYGWLREMLAECKLETEDEKELLAGIQSEISLVKGERIELEYYYPKACSKEVFQYFCQGYERRLRQGGLIDFDDMLVMTYELFSKRQDILSSWQKKYSYILIDEFQDINKTQYDIVRLLAGENRNLFVVGDDDQSIYRFRGAKPDIMLGFEKQYPEAVKIVLEKNYRSTRAIVDAAGRVIGCNTKRFRKQISTENKTGEPVEVRAFPNPSMQNKELARKLREYQERGTGYSDMAVLFRTNTDARLLVEYLMEYNIPFRLKEALPDIYDHWISKDIITYTKIAMGSRARADFLKIINRPKRYISRDCLDTPEISFDRLLFYYEDKRWMAERIERLEEDISFMRDMPPYAAISYVRKAVGYEEYLKEYAQTRHIAVEELFTVLDELQESAEGFQTAEEWFAHIQEYKEELRQQEQQAKEENTDAVVLSTLHASKGLEYAVVFLTDVNETVIPYKKAVLDEDIEEERRMLYVGMTRAKERLHIYYVRERYHKQLEPSRFLVEAGMIPAQEGR
ncbi:MAG: ATP-dependent helicase [Lachnospiraceae bacterium]|nr:ATP-dependent helicase [Lachnospiraceae bacterium]